MGVSCTHTEVINTLNKGSITLFIADGGEIYLWDLRQSRSCLRRFIDEGCVKGTSLAVSPDGARLAAGSDSGVVNLYDTRYLRSINDIIIL